MTDGQKIKKGLLLCFGLTFVIVGIIMVWFSRASILDFIAEMKDPYDALSVGKDEMKPGDHVTVDVVLTEGYFMYSSEALTKGNTYSYASTTRYYLVPVLEMKDGYYRLEHLVAVSKTGQFKNIDAAAKKYIAWWNGEGEMPTEKVYSVEGRVVKLTDKEIGYLKEYFEDEDYRDYMNPYVIKPLWDGWKSGKSGAIMMPIASIVVALLGGMMIFFGFRTGKKAQTAAQTQGMLMQQMPPMQQNPGYPGQNNTDNQNPPYQG